MKRSIVNIVSVLSLSAVIFSGCQKKKEEYATPAIETLRTEVSLNLPLYKHEYTKQPDGMFSLTNLDATVIMKRTGSFFEMEIFSVPDTSLPDTTKGEYDKLSFIAPDTVKHLFNSPVAGNMTATSVLCPLTFSDGTAKDFKAGKAVTLSHTEDARSELEALYLDQLEEEYTKMVSDMMWKEIETQSAHRFTREESRERYRLTVQSKVITSTIPETTLKVEGDKAELTYDGTLIFVFQFVGLVDVVK